MGMGPYREARTAAWLSVEAVHEITAETRAQQNIRVVRLRVYFKHEKVKMLLFGIITPSNAIRDFMDHKSSKNKTTVIEHHIISHKRKWIGRNIFQEVFIRYKHMRHHIHISLNISGD